jgi:hypothetical protein
MSMNEAMTIESRIVARFLQNLDSDELVPKEVARRMQSFFQQGGVKDADGILDAIRQGVKDHAKNSTT